MKKFTLIFALVFISLASISQTHRVLIFCNIDIFSNIDYYHMEDFLPDSIKTNVLIDYKKDNNFKRKDRDRVFLLMTANGWKLVTEGSHVSGNFSFTTSSSDYILSREILLDEAAWNLYIAKLKNVKAKEE